MKKYIHFLLIFITFPQIHVQGETCIKLSNKTVQNRVNSYFVCPFDYTAFAVSGKFGIP